MLARLNRNDRGRFGISFFKTRITELFGIEYPIIQGGMAVGLVSTAELAAAVGNAGGIGFMCAIQWIEDVGKKSRRSRG